MSEKIDNKKAQSRGKLFVASGPSGAGKSTLCNEALACFDKMSFSVSYTTRAPRAGETDGVEYCFIDQKSFNEMVDKGEFLEHAGVHGKCYGTAATDIEKLLKEGVDVLLDIDVQGAAQLMEARKDGIYIFVLPPSMDACAKRLDARGDLKEEELAARLNIARDEMKSAKDYDYVIINDRLSESFDKFKAIVTAERAKRAQVAPEVLSLFQISID